MLEPSHWQRRESVPDAAPHWDEGDGRRERGGWTGRSRRSRTGPHHLRRRCAEGHRVTVLLAAAPFGIQALATMADEFYFHRRRGLPRWERIGHPLDTLTVLGCYAVALALPLTATSLRVYLALAAFSCLFVTKDELVHAKHCDPLEHWVHALLFVLHPVVLASMGFLWLREARTMMLAQCALTLAFGLYQTLYWNTKWMRSP